MIANRIIGGVSCFVWLCSAASVYAGSHTWRINELFSDATGVIQYIELHECCGSPDEILVQNLTVTSDVTGNEFVFPEFLTGDTSNAYLLLATQGFAELENAPAPDYIIADNFFALDGDVIRYAPAGNFHTVSFDGDDLPTDGFNAMHITCYVFNTLESGVNTATNFSGTTGTINLNPSAVPAISLNRILIAFAVLSIVGAGVSRRNPIHFRS